MRNGSTGRRLHIIVVATNLEAGGAESVLYNLLSEINKDDFKVTVISLIGEGVVGKKFSGLGLPVYTMEMSRRSVNITRIIGLARLIKELDADIVQTWMYHANIIGGVAARVAGVKQVVWSIHSAMPKIRYHGLLTSLVVRVGAYLSRSLPRKIIFCSNYAIGNHIKIGYDRRLITYIPNGFDTKKYSPSGLSSDRIREELGLDRNTILVGMIARYDPAKGHKLFLQSAEEVSRNVKNVRFVLCGNGVEKENERLWGWIVANELEEKVILLGERTDVERILAALDVAVLASETEAFPMVVGEAMSCGVPSISTDVGDAKLIIGDGRMIAKVGDAKQLAEKIVWLASLTSEERESIGKDARERIVKNYSIGKIVARYEELYRGMLFDGERDAA